MPELFGDENAPQDNAPHELFWILCICKTRAERVERIRESM